MKYMTKKQAESEFRDIFPSSELSKLDKHAQRLEWTIYTDNLCKNNQISQSQYSRWSYPNFIK
jgi:hypothetical protein